MLFGKSFVNLQPNYNEKYENGAFGFQKYFLYINKMELTKSDKRQLKDIIQRGILRRCEEWLKETSELINKEYEEDENAFDRCMKVTKRSRDYFKEAMRREDYYRNTMMLSGTAALLAEGYLTLDDIEVCREEVQAAIRLWARMDE